MIISYDPETHILWFLCLKLGIVNDLSFVLVGLASDSNFLMTEIELYNRLIGVTPFVFYKSYVLVATTGFFPSMLGGHSCLTKLLKSALVL